MNLGALRLAFAGSLLLGVVACESTPQTQAGSRGGPGSVPGSIALEHLVSGQQVYRVTLFENGEVLFEGLVPGEGRRTLTRKIAPAEAERVFRQLDVINIWEREPRYDVERVMRGGDEVIGRTAPADGPWDVLHAQSRGRSKHIESFAFAPAELLDFKALVEKATRLADFLSAATDPAAAAR